MKVGDRVKVIRYNAPGIIEEIGTCIVVLFEPSIVLNNGATLFRYIAKPEDLVLLDIPDNPEWSDSWEDSSK